MSQKSTSPLVPALASGAIAEPFACGRACSPAAPPASESSSNAFDPASETDARPGEKPPWDAAELSAAGPPKSKP